MHQRTGKRSTSSSWTRKHLVKMYQLRVPKKVAYETTEVVELKSRPQNQENRFLAYAGGHYLGSSRSFVKALDLAYDRMGVVTDQNHDILWNRVNRPPFIKHEESNEKGRGFLPESSGLCGKWSERRRFHDRCQRC